MSLHALHSARISIAAMCSIAVLSAHSQPRFPHTARTPQATASAASRTTMQSKVLPTGQYGRMSEARTASAQVSLRNVSRAVEMSYADTGRLPAGQDGLSILLERPAGVKDWRGPYIAGSQKKDPFSDPWGNRYRYVDTTTTGSAAPSFMIKSNGPDGIPDTSDDLSTGY
jgi:general secretion pathway protein G